MSSELEIFVDELERQGTTLQGAIERAKARIASAPPAPDGVSGEYQDGISAGQAVATLSSCFASDPAYAWGWHCNLAMAAVDEGLGHAAANRAAARFMYAAFGVDTTAALAAQVAEKQGGAE